MIKNILAAGLSGERNITHSLTQPLIHLALLFPVISLLILVSCSGRNKDTYGDEEEKRLIEKTIRTSIGWAASKDLALLYSVIANDSGYLEVHPGITVVKGFAEFKKQERLWMSPDFKAIGYNLKDLKIELSQSRTVAWWYGVLNDYSSWKGAPANWENTRWTGVLEKRNGNWVIVQMHFSFAVNRS